MKNFAPAITALALFFGGFARAGETCDVSVRIPGPQVIDLARPYVQNFLNHPEKLQKAINTALEKLGTIRTGSFSVPGAVIGNMNGDANVQELFQNIRIGKLQFGDWNMALEQTANGPAYRVRARISRLMVGADTEMIELPDAKQYTPQDKPKGTVRIGIKELSKDFDGTHLAPFKQMEVQFLVRVNPTGSIPLKPNVLEYVPGSVSVSMPYLEAVGAKSEVGEISKVLGDLYHSAPYDDGVCATDISPQSHQMTGWWNSTKKAVGAAEDWVGDKASSSWRWTKTATVDTRFNIPIDDKDGVYAENKWSLTLLSALKEYDRYRKMTPAEIDKLGFREKGLMTRMDDLMKSGFPYWKKTVLDGQLAPLLAKNISDALEQMDIFGSDAHEFPLVQKAHITGEMPYPVEQGGFYSVQNLRVARIDPNGDIYLGADGCRVDDHFLAGLILPSGPTFAPSTVKSAAVGEKHEDLGFVIPKTVDANLSYRMINDYVADSFEHEADHQFQINGHPIQVETPPQFETVQGPDGKPVMRITMSVTEQEYSKYTQYYLGLPLKARPELTVKEKDGKVDLALDPASLLTGLPDDSTHSTIAGIDTGHTSSGRFKSEMERKYSDFFRKLFELDPQKKFNITLKKFEPTPNGQGVHLIFDLPDDLDFKPHTLP